MVYQSPAQTYIFPKRDTIASRILLHLKHAQQKEPEDTLEKELQSPTAPED